MATFFPPGWKPRSLRQAGCAGCLPPQTVRGSFNLQQWTRIGAMNRSPLLGAPASLPASFRTNTGTRRQGCRRSQARFVGRVKNAPVGSNRVRRLVPGN